MGRRIGDLEGRVAKPSRAGGLDQRFGNVGTQDMPLGTDRLRKIGRRAAGAASDIEHPLPGLRGGGRERDSLKPAMPRWMRSYAPSHIVPPAPFQ